MYTFSDVLFLRVIADLLANGIEVKRLKEALQKARAETAAWIDIRRAPRRFLVTDGTELFVRRMSKLESKTIDRQLAFAFVLDLGPTHRAVADEWPQGRHTKMRTKSS
jgi:DNA-binding transcriptional MerR regulator